MAEQIFLALLVREGISPPMREFPAIPNRRHRFDFAWPEHRLLVEVHGGVFTHGRHNSGSGFTADREKMNLGQLEGYAVLEYPSHVLERDPSYVVGQIRRAMWKSLR